MHYDRSYFDSPVDRHGTDCEKWEAIPAHEGRELLPMWVADMDLRCPAEISEALGQRAAHAIYGYTRESEAQVNALLSFLKRRHGLNLTPEQQFTLPCVVTGLRAAVRALTEPGDRVIIQPPVYGPFLNSITENGRTAVENPLIRDEWGCYTMDFDGLEQLCKDGAKLMLLCNPHNPVGRCFRREELSRLWVLLSRYDVALISDEIHWDFVYEQGAFTSMLALEQGHEAKLAVLTSASKSFNLAGLLQATLLTRNPAVLEAISTEMQVSGAGQGNLFSFLATAVAYEQGDEWLDALLSYLREAREIIETEVQRRLPKAILSPIEATYLAWLDLRAYGYSTKELMRRTYEQGVAFSEGTFFGKNTGEGFLRVNFACPHSQLRKAMVRLEKALHS